MKIRCLLVPVLATLPFKTATAAFSPTVDSASHDIKADVTAGAVGSAAAANEEFNMFNAARAGGRKTRIATAAAALAAAVLAVGIVRFFKSRSKEEELPSGPEGKAEAPGLPDGPAVPEEPAVPEVPSLLEFPKVPIPPEPEPQEVPETPIVPEPQEVPETPIVPEPQEVPETPKVPKEGAPDTVSPENNIIRALLAPAFPCNKDSIGIEYCFPQRAFACLSVARGPSFRWQVLPQSAVVKKHKPLRSAYKWAPWMDQLYRPEGRAFLSFCA